jgi:hypothetical protein
MPITRLLQDTAFGPDEIAVLVAAYEDALRALSLVNRTDLATEMVAKKIIELAKESVIQYDCASVSLKRYPDHRRARPPSPRS